MDKHLEILARKHIETKFIKVRSLAWAWEVCVGDLVRVGFITRAPNPRADSTPWTRPQIQAEKSPFLTERLRVWMLPTLALMRLGKTVDYVVGFADLGGADDFPTSALAARCGAGGATPRMLPPLKDLLPQPAGAQANNAAFHSMRKAQG